MEVFILVAVVCAAIGFGIFWFGLFGSGAGGRLILERDVVGLETALAAYRATKEQRE